MALIATEAKRLSNVVKQELWPETGYCRKVVAVDTDVVVGTVILDMMNQVLGVAMAEAAAGTNVLALVKGPAIVSKAGLVFDGQIMANEVYAALEAKGIACNDAV